MSITGKELAKLLNLSEAAVSMALNRKPGVSTATRARVLEAAAENGYDFTHLRDTAVPKVEKGSISLMIYKKHGAVVADTPFFDQLIKGIESECRQACYSLNIHYLYEDDDIPAQLGSLCYCNGAILLATEMEMRDFQPFDALKMPLVVLDTYFESLKYDCILINNFQGAYQAANYLIRRSKSQPGYLRSSYPVGNFEERADGFYKAIRDSGMSASKSPVLRLTPSLEGACEDMRELLKNGEEPARCYFADNDLIAAGAIRAPQEFGYRIPRDVGIIGFDDMPLCVCIEPRLTTVNVPKQYMGKVAVTRLLQIMEPGEHYPVKLEIGTSIVTRRSV